MRRIQGLFLAVVVLAAGSAAGAEEGGIAWQTDYEQARQTAEEQGRPLLVYVTRAGCQYCTMMKKRTLSQGAVAQQINREFVPVAIDAHERRELVRELKVRAYPTTLVIDGNEKTVVRIKGYVSADQFRKRLLVAEHKSDSASRLR